MPASAELYAWSTLSWSLLQAPWEAFKMSLAGKWQTKSSEHWSNWAITRYWQNSKKKTLSQQNVCVWWPLTHISTCGSHKCVTPAVCGILGLHVLTHRTTVLHQQHKSQLKGVENKEWKKWFLAQATLTDDGDRPAGAYTFPATLLTFIAEDWKHLLAAEEGCELDTLRSLIELCGELFADVLDCLLFGDTRDDSELRTRVLRRLQKQNSSVKQHPKIRNFQFLYK